MTNRSSSSVLFIRNAQASSEEHEFAFYQTVAFGPSPEFSSVVM